MDDEEHFEFEKIGRLIGPHHFLWVFILFFPIAHSYSDPNHLPGYYLGDRWMRCWNFPDFIYGGEYCHNPQTDTAFLFASLFESVVIVLTLAVIFRILRGSSEPEPEPEPEEPVCELEGFCEFDYPEASNNYEAEGRCWHCGKIESPEFVGLMMVGQDRFQILRDMEDDLDDATYDRLQQMFQAIHDSEIDFANSGEGTPESRLEELKAMDDCEQILAAMAPHLDEATYEKFGRELDAHRERFRAWEPKAN
ncbi:MAG: hypothetical protein CXX69_01525 [Candidatus Thalassarchaeum betae]|uniref:Uncharacterized protein n=1 Tax=Candidatus Thalassarchaeum betae TaxID=2599289 RepID=A0A2V3HSI5_9ARCH|nr:MAG: hypothetical protein CXX69_01525 [Candidatus Thalassoarchaea betae]HIM92698.1 hypothetical protein [Candidatus Poseidoniales archaeon]